MNVFMSFITLFTFLTHATMLHPVMNGQLNTAPPATPVKLIFIHHSTGGNWLADPAANELGGGLGRALMENNYYVSATNYGWGPDSIGDATDIPNWLDWFRGERSSAYLEALYTEDGQNIGDFGSWPRLAEDPGGENQVILFKSCFPNSDLEGNPQDQAGPEGWLSVSNAKYVYNEILKYFGSRPDKLFVVITAPPLQHSAFAENARAFNLWLVEDWLAENDYPLNNVAVFDFFNVLTGPDHHHRVVEGQFEHTYQVGNNTLYYPSGDDHPSQAGNIKATQEFIPLLNSFYHRWADALGEQSVEVSESEAAEALSPEPEEAVILPGAAGAFFEGFESDGHGWEVFSDETGAGQINVTIVNDRVYEGDYALHVQFAVEGEGWATFARFFEASQDWRAYEGLSFALLPGEGGNWLDVHIYGGSPEALESYVYRLETPASSNAWEPVMIPWDEFRRVAWEENPGTAFSKTDQVMGVAFGFPAGDGFANSGEVWVDSVSLWTGGEPQLAPVTDPIANEVLVETGAENVQEENDQGAGLPFCGGMLALPLGLVVLGWCRRQR